MSSIALQTAMQDGQTVMQMQNCINTIHIHNNHSMFHMRHTSEHSTPLHKILTHHYSLALFSTCKLHLLTFKWNIWAVKYEISRGNYEQKSNVLWIFPTGFQSESYRIFFCSIRDFTLDFCLGLDTVCITSHKSQSKNSSFVWNVPSNQIYFTGF